MASIPEQPHLRVLAIGYGISALLLLPAAIRRRLWRRPVRSIANSVIVGTGILCLPQILIFSSSRYLSPAVVIAAVAAVPVLVAISGRLSITTAVGGLAGVLFLTSNGLSVAVPQIPWLLLPLAAAAVLALSLTAAERQLCGISIPAISIPEISMVDALFAQCAVSALLLWVTSPLLERQPVTWSATAALGFLTAGAVMTLCGYLLFYWLLGKSGAGTVSMLQWTQPLIATAESAVWMHIRPDWTAVLGGTLIVAATLWAFSNRDDQGVMFEITQT